MKTQNTLDVFSCFLQLEMSFPDPLGVPASSTAMWSHTSESAQHRSGALSGPDPPPSGARQRVSECSDGERMTIQTLHMSLMIGAARSHWCDSTLLCCSQALPTGPGNSFPAVKNMTTRPTCSATYRVFENLRKSQNFDSIEFGMWILNHCDVKS